MEKNHLKFKHPFTCIVSGPSGSGKTELVSRIIKNRHNLITHEINKINWYFSEWQDGYKSINDVRFYQGIPTKEHLEETLPDLIVIDDLMNEMKTSSDVLNIFTKFSHHMNISVILILQNLFFNSKHMRTISLNSHYIIVMKNPRDKSQIIHLAKQMYPGNTKFFVEAYNDATSKPYGYIKADFTPSTPDDMRLSTRITTEEYNNKALYPIVYREKNV